MTHTHTITLRRGDDLGDNSKYPRYTVTRSGPLSFLLGEKTLALFLIDESEEDDHFGILRADSVGISIQSVVHSEPEARQRVYDAAAEYARGKYQDLLNRGWKPVILTEPRAQEQ